MSKFKTKQGTWLSQSLFLECGYNLQYATFTLADEDKEYKDKIYISLKKLFLEAEDPTEYDFATRHLGGWSHWKKIAANGILSPHIEEWREELELKLRARGVHSMIQEATMGGRGQATAARWLAEKGFTDTPTQPKRRVGRPKKDTSKEDAKLKSIVQEEYAEDLERVSKLN